MLKAAVISFVHIVLSGASLAFGAFIFFNPKGTQTHRRFGKLYCVSMLGVNFAALSIYHLTGHFNMFHLTAILSMVLVLTGWAQVIFRRHLRNWLYRHYVYMCWSYVALVAAALNEGFVRVGPLKALVRHNGNWIIIASQAVLVSLAAIFITRSKQGVLARYGMSVLS